MAAKFATGWAATLTADLSTTATVLPIRVSSADKLCAILGATDHTFIVLSNGVDVEIVRATCPSGSGIIIERSEDPIPVPQGACVRFEVTEDLLADYVTPNDAICSIVGEGGIVVTQEGCAVTLTLGADCDEVTWRSGNTVYQFVDGCVTSTAATECVLVPGQYTNATITVDTNGNLCAITQGSNIVYSSNPCCPNCDDEGG